MTPFEIQSCRERYLDLIARYLQGRLNDSAFRMSLSAPWNEEREAVWQTVYKMTHSERCEEQQCRALGKPIISLSSDPRRLPRMLDRISTLKKGGEQPRAVVSELLAAYRTPEMTEGEGRYVNCLPSIPVFERPLPSGGNFRYPCTVEDIRRQLSWVPEYDLEGIKAIGLTHPKREDSDAYGIYYRRWYPIKAPLIVLHSVPIKTEFKLGAYYPGFVKREYQVSFDYGARIEREGRIAVMRWSEEAIRRYVVEHTLLHEIGHHVQYQQRQRAGYFRRLSRRVKEQFAEDYALRFNRRRRQEQNLPYVRF